MGKKQTVLEDAGSRGRVVITEQVTTARPGVGDPRYS